MIWSRPFRMARRRLGVQVGDPAFPPADFLDAASSVIDRLQQDCAQTNENVLLLEVTLGPDAPDGRVYTASTQVAPVTSLMRAMMVRLRNRDGVELDERPLSQIDAYAGMAYALTGGEANRVLITSPSVGTGTSLFLRYIPAAREVLGESDTVPTFVPDGYADLLGLMVAEELWSNGGEQQMPREQGERLEDRLGQLYERWAKTTATPLMRRSTGDGITPYLF